MAVWMASQCGPLSSTACAAGTGTVLSAPSPGLSRWPSAAWGVVNSVCLDPVQSSLATSENMSRAKISGEGLLPSALWLPSLRGRLSHSSEMRLRLLYKRGVRSSSDPYKRAVCCLVGRCEVADSHPDVCSKTEDYMWLKVLFSLPKVNFDLPRCSAESGVL